MYLVKFKPLTVLAVEWKGDNQKEICDLLGKENCAFNDKIHNELRIFGSHGEDIQVEQGEFIVNYNGTFIVLSMSNFLTLFQNYLPPDGLLDGINF